MDMIDLDAMLQMRQEQRDDAIPGVGDAATIHAGSDRYPGTVLRVDFDRDGEVKRILVQEDAWWVIRGHGDDGSARYGYRPDSQGREWNVQRRPNGTWHTGTWSVTFGSRSRYSDPSF
jgi:hypothetical protein